MPLSSLLKDGCFFIDNSGLEKYITCPRLFFLELVRKRVPAVPRIALDFGGAIHEALAYRYVNEPAGLFSDDTQQAIITELFEGIDVPENEWRTREFASLLLTKYNIQYLNEEFEVLKLPNGQPMVELPFAIYFGTQNILAPGGDVICVPIIYTGKIDLVIKTPMGIFVLDHKTTSVLGPTWWQEQAVSPQYDGYIHAVLRTTDYAPIGYWVNALGIRKPTKTGTSIQFERQMFIADAQRQAEWKRNTMEIIQRLLRDAAFDTYPMHRKSCVSKYGACSMYDVCSLPADNREALLTSGSFRDNDWSPLTAVEDAEKAKSTLL
jgi:hypothetical protein